MPVTRKNAAAKIKVWIDNGHGANTAGKHSPDLRLREYRWTREVAALVVDGLQADGIDAGLLVPESWDVPIKSRCERVNRTCVERGADRVLLVSLHNNAAACDGLWHDANYWSCWVYRQEIKDSNGRLIQVKEASAASKALATMFSAAARSFGYKVSTGGRGEYMEANFGLLRGTLCPAVLTENFFQDNRQAVDWLLLPEAKTTLALLHINTIENYLYKYGK